MHQPARTSARGWWAVPLVSAVCLAATVGLAWRGAAASPRAIVALELAGTASAARSVVGSSIEPFRAAITADWPFIAAYGIGLGGACALGVRRFRTRGARGIAAGGLGAVAGAAAADVVENVLLWRGLTRLRSGEADALFAGTRAAAAIKFALVGIGVVVALVAILTTWLRARRP